MTPKFDQLVNEVFPLAAIVPAIVALGSRAPSPDKFGITDPADQRNFHKRSQDPKFRQYINKKYPGARGKMFRGLATDLIPGGSSKKAITKGYKMARKAGVSKNVARVGAQVAGAADRTMRT